MSCCGGCFEGLFSKSHELRPDSSPQKQPRPVKSYTEALQLERSREGTWQASPKTSFDWASPIPRRRPSVVSVDGPVDFDIVIDIDDGSKAEPRTQTIDTDIPANRVGAQNRERSRFEKEMLLASPGRLPPPLTADQREEAIRQLLPTATFQMLAKVPKKLLTQADESAKKLRRLNNATRHACCEARKSPRLPLELAGHPLHGPCLQAQKGAFLIPALLRFPRFANMATEVLKISDGTTMDTRRATAIGDIMLRDGCRLEICRLPDVDDQTWAEVRAYVEGNPDTAKTLKSFSKNPDAMRGWLQTQAIAEHYSAKLANGDTPVQDKVKSLEADPELAAIFEDIKKNGMEAAMKYYQDEELMLKISQKMGGLPSELQPVLQKIEDTSLTLHEAAKNGDLAAVQQFLDKNKPLDAQDHKGITPLGYAIGANRIAVVKKLLDSRANPYAVDSSGNSGLHYAAGYGRKELLEQLMRGATVVFVTAGLPGKRFTFEIAASLGIKPVILEHPDSWSRSLVDEGLAAKFIPVDMTQPSEDIFNQALEHIKNLGEDGLTGTADGIATFMELSVPLAARLAEALGLQGLRPAAVDSARNKHATRACLKTAGLPTPRNFLIDDKSKLKEAGTAVGFPAVLKPVSGAASLGVKKVTNSVEMEKCYKEIVDELSTLVVSSGALVQGSPDNAGLNAQESGVDLTVLMEQFLDGPEVDVDVVMSEGRRLKKVADLNTTLVAYSILYACLVLVGGIMGFASTIVSLVLIAVVYATVQVNAFYGSCVMCVFSLVLVRMFFQKFNKSGEEKLNEPLTGDGSQKKFMPFGLLTVLTPGSTRVWFLREFTDNKAVKHGEYVYACVADNGPTLEPYFNETWACCPSLLPKDQQVALRDLGVQCIKALGFTSGVFHVELKYTSHGPQLIEVNARMGGGQVHECNRLTWGVDLVEETMLCALGIPSRPCVPREPVSGTAYCYVNAMKSGTVTDVSKLEELRKRDNVVWAKPLTRVGVKAVGPADGLPTLLCDLFVQGKTAKDALAYLQAIEKENPVLVA
eukprot:s1130_g6.t2